MGDQLITYIEDGVNINTKNVTDIEPASAKMSKTNNLRILATLCNNSVWRFWLIRQPLDIAGVVKL